MKKILLITVLLFNWNYLYSNTESKDNSFDLYGGVSSGYFFTQGGFLIGLERYEENNLMPSIEFIVPSSISAIIRYKINVHKDFNISPLVGFECYAFALINPDEPSIAKYYFSYKYGMAMDIPLKLIPFNNYKIRVLFIGTDLHLEGSYINRNFSIVTVIYFDKDI